MTNTEEWLREVAGEPTQHPNLTPEEWEAIRDEVFDSPWNDPSKVPDCLKEALKTLGEIGTSASPNPARDATQCLRRMARRAAIGVPYGELEEPVFPRCTSDRCKQTSLGGCRDCT